MITDLKIKMLKILSIVMCLCSLSRKTDYCSDEQWECLDGRRCLDKMYVCDLVMHCTDGSDETPELCALWQCPSNMLRCTCKEQWIQTDSYYDAWSRCPNHWCLQNEYICDGEPYNDNKPNHESCHGLDETMELCSEWTCPKG